MYKTVKIYPINLILLSLLLYELIDFMQIFYISNNYIKLVPIFILSIAFIQAPKNKILKYSLSYKIFIIISFFIIIRGSLLGMYFVDEKYSYSSLNGIIRNAISAHSLFAFLLPLAATLKWNNLIIRNIKNIAIISFIFIIINIYEYRNLLFIGNGNQYIEGLISTVGGKEVSIRFFVNSIFVGLGSILLLSFCINYYNKRIYYLFPVILFLYFFCVVAGGGRGDSAMALCYIFTCIFVHYKYPIQIKNMKILRKILLLFSFIIVIYVIYYIYSNTTLFDLIIKRSFGNEIDGDFNVSGRDDFKVQMINDFNSHPLAWLFGRGINGTYQLLSGARRPWIEWGYMWLILKGGLIFFISYCYVLLKSAFNGFFHSRNLLCKSFSFLCVWQVVSLIPFGLPQVSILYFIVWLGVGVLHNKVILKMENKDLIKIFNE